MVQGEKKKKKRLHPKLKLWPALSFLFHSQFPITSQCTVYLLTSWGRKIDNLSTEASAALGSTSHGLALALHRFTDLSPPPTPISLVCVP